MNSVARCLLLLGGGAVAWAGYAALALSKAAGEENWMSVGTLFSAIIVGTLGLGMVLAAFLYDP